VVQPVLDTAAWAEQNFGMCDLGDVRRTRRAVRLARQMAGNPAGSTPAQTETWGDLKAAYRLVDHEDVTFAALAGPHWRQTCARARGLVLVIGDTTELDFGIHRQVEGLGPTGDGFGRGFFLHNALMVDPVSRQILGLAGQELFYRRPRPKQENSYRASQRQGKESEVWGRLIAQIGPPADGVRYLHTFDRGADNLDVFCQLLKQRGDWVIRAAQLHRKVLPDGEASSRALSDVLATRPVLGRYELPVRATKKTPARTALLEVRAAQVTIPAPTKRRTVLQRELQFAGLTQWVVEAREVSPPRGMPAVRWVLWTSLPAATFDAAWQILGYYEQRWLVEEFHKALKTGCRLEHRQYQTAHSLEALAGFSSVLAVRLVQLKTIAQTAPQTPARHVIPRIWLDMLQHLRQRPISTVRDFYRHLAGLGGFLLRKHDGEPGWITLWRGLDKLRLAIRGFLAMKNKCG
jgi:Transposase DNA-binding/Transposase DDE domain